MLSICFVRTKNTTKPLPSTALPPSVSLVVSYGSVGSQQIYRLKHTAATAVSKEEGVLHVQGIEGNYKVVVPLPSYGPRLFTLPQGPIRNFISVLKIDDPAIKDVDIYDVNEVRIASSMNTTELVRNDFKLKINQTFHLVSSPRNKIDEKISSKPEFQKIEEFFHERARDNDTITYDEYLLKATELGLDEQSAKEILLALNCGGQILYFENNFELNNTIFLQPTKISNQIEKILKVNYLRRSYVEKNKRLQQLKTEMLQMESKKGTIEKKANQTVKMAAWSLFTFLSLQSLLFARLVWWDFDWGTMEPVTWFTSVCEMTIGGYIYYLVIRQEYSNTQVAGFIAKRRFDRLCQVYGLDMVRMENLKKRIKQIEADVESEKTVRELLKE